MDLVQVDVAAAHAFDGFLRAPVHDLAVVAVGAPRLTLGMPGHVVAGLILVAMYHVLALERAVGDALREPVADPALGQGAVVPCHGVKLGGVQEVDAELPELIQLRVRIGLVRVEGAPRHRPAAHLRHHHVGGAELHLAKCGAAGDRLGSGGIVRIAHREDRNERGVT